METTLPYLTATMAFFALIFQIGVALIGDGGWLNFITPAKIRFIRTNILRKGNEYVQGIILANKGGKLARDTIVRLDFSNSEITDLQFEEQAFQIKPEIKDGGVGKNYIVITFDRIIPKSRGTIYITTKGKQEYPEIGVTHDDRAGLEEDFTYKRPFLDKLAIIIGLFALFWIFINPLFNP